MRYRLMRTFLATLAFSQGVPMFAHGDELARTQKGNNNAYAQDNEITWINWDLDERQKGLVDFTRKLIAIRQAHPVLRRRHFFRGAAVRGSDHKDVTWLHPDGKEMTNDSWRNPSGHTLGMLIDGMATDEVDERGHAVCGDSLLIILNGGEQAVTFTLPELEDKKIWVIMVDTARNELPVVRESSVEMEAHSLMLLRFGSDRRVSSIEEVRREPLSPVAKHTL
jgi:isoamylase